MSNRAFFLMHLNDHIQYLKEIDATLTDKSNFQGTHHRECKLGKWLYGEGTAEVANLHNIKAQEIFDSLFDPHERFHAVSMEALERKRIGDQEGARQALTEMHILSCAISQRLLALDDLT